MMIIMSEIQVTMIDDYKMHKTKKNCDTVAQYAGFIFG